MATNASGPSIENGPDDEDFEAIRKTLTETRLVVQDSREPEELDADSGEFRRDLYGRLRG
jgi:hypothetical protein